MCDFTIEIAQIQEKEPVLGFRSFSKFSIEELDRGTEGEEAVGKHRGMARERGRERERERES